MSRLVAGIRAASAAGRGDADLLAPTASWNLSQTLQHCAQTIGYSVTGYPALKPWLFRATAGALAKRLFLARGATKHDLDAELDGAPPLDAALPVADALARLDRAVDAFDAHGGPHPPHPAYGNCRHDEYARLHAMHLREHLPGLAA